MKYNLFLIFAIVVMINSMSNHAYAKENVEVTIKDKLKHDSSYCLYLSIKNNSLKEMSLNLFGGQMLKNIEGAEAEYDWWTTLNTKPALDPNLKLVRGELGSGWSCWKLPTFDFEPDRLVLYQLITNKRYAIVELENSNRQSDRQVSIMDRRNNTQQQTYKGDETRKGNFIDRETYRDR